MALNGLNTFMITFFPLYDQLEDAERNFSCSEKNTANDSYTESLKFC